MEKYVSIRTRIITEYEMRETDYSRIQVIYDNRKLRAHGIVDKLNGRNCYRLTS